MAKRIAAFVLMLTMVLSLLVGCGGTSNKPGGNDGEQVLTVGVPQTSGVTDWYDNAFTQYLEEKIGAKIEFVFFSINGSSMEKQLNLMIAADEELPDVLWGFQQVGTDGMNLLGEQGYLLDLTDLIDQYAVNYKAGLAELPEEEQHRVLSKGTDVVDSGFYGMPTIGTGITDDNMSGMTYINKKWLDAVGKDVPTTVDELYDVLKAFKNSDPNGNGRQDEIPIFGTASGIATAGTATSFIMNAFVYAHPIYKSGYSLNVTNGKVWSPVITDEWRQGIAYIAKLVKEGLMGDMSFTGGSQAELVSAVIGNGAGAQVGIFTAHPAAFSSSDPEILEEYVALPALKDATGKGGYFVTEPNALNFGGYITSSCKDVELAMKFLDCFYTDETYLAMRFGVEGEDWKRVDGKSWGGQEAIVKVINQQAFFKGNSTWNLLSLGFLYRNGCLIDNEGNGVQMTQMLNETYEAMQTAKIKEEIIDNVVLNEDEMEVNTKYWVSYADYTGQFLAQCAVGEKNVNDDGTWNEYINHMETVGLSKLLEIYQAAYDRYTAE